MYCGKCGRKIPDGARFCGGCGTPVPEAAKRRGGKARKKKAPLGVLIALALILITAGGLLLLHHARSPVRRFEAGLKQSLKQEQLSDTDGARLEAAVLEKMEYELRSLDRQKAAVTVTAPDMRKLLLPEGEGLLLQRDGLQTAVSRLEAGLYDTLTTTVEVTLDEEGNPEEPYPLYDAMYGGLYTAVSDFLGEMEGTE